MRYLLIAPQLGFDSYGKIKPSGLLTFARLVARALASSSSINKLGIWCQVDNSNTKQFIEAMVTAYAHPMLSLDVRCFNGNRLRLAYEIAKTSAIHNYDHIMYLLINQAILSNLPWHLPYTVWEIGEELFQPVSFLKYRAIRNASNLLSISKKTTEVAVQHNPGLPKAKVVHLCVEPPLFDPHAEDGETISPYDPLSRKPAVLIVSNLHSGRLFYKGHKELIEAWEKVVQYCPNAELWIGGDGSAREQLQIQANSMPKFVADRIMFLGKLDDYELDLRYRTCRVFAMPSNKEGFGLVFVEAARYGIPSIGCQDDAAQELIRQNETGLLVEQSPIEIAEACIRLLTDDKLAARLGKSARLHYEENFRYNHFKERLLSALDLEALNNN